ncbi:MAG: hypothetical protein ACLP8S_11940 [Solirubrobacteraceae bacterium]
MSANRRLSTTYPPSNASDEPQAWAMSGLELPPNAGQLAPQWLAHTPRLVDQRRCQKLDHSGRDGL